MLQQLDHVDTVHRAFAPCVTRQCKGQELTLAIKVTDTEFDLVDLHGNHYIPTVLTQTAGEGSVTRMLKLCQIGPEFLERMFLMEDVR